MITPEGLAGSWLAFLVLYLAWGYYVRKTYKPSPAEKWNAEYDQHRANVVLAAVAWHMDAKGSKEHLHEAVKAYIDHARVEKAFQERYKQPPPPPKIPTILPPFRNTPTPPTSDGKTVLK